MVHELDRLDVVLADRVTAYAEVRTALEYRLGTVVENVRDASDDLISRVEEFGPEHALETFASEMPAGYFPDGLVDELKNLVEAQDRIDEALLAREVIARGIDEDRDQRVSLQGEIYRIDRTDDPNPQLVREEPAELSLTQQFALEQGHEPAQPIPDMDRTRSR